jgi:hypothetical protein
LLFLFSGENPTAESFVNKESFELIAKGLELWKLFLARDNFSPHSRILCNQRKFRINCLGGKIMETIFGKK